MTAQLYFLSNEGLQISYHCSAPSASLQIPPRKPAARGDGLWRTTCCELFIGLDGSSAYREFNFSPSGEWAIYDFAAYRDKVEDFALPANVAPSIAFSVTPDGWRLNAAIPAKFLYRDADEIAQATHCSITSVLEASDGGLSYWALTHPQEKPDFHDRGGFILPASAIETVRR
jgi:hypothetical protein